MIDPATLRSRTVRECILRCVSIADKAGVTIGFSLQQVFDGFMTSELQYTPDDVRPELNDLVDDGMIEKFDDPAGGGEKRYRITTRGRDFVRARFPWGRVDEFTGDQRLI